MVLPATMLCLLAATGAQNGIRITTIPPVLALPAPPGQNLILEVEVPGQARSVWLGLDRADDTRIPLTFAGGRRWQINLAGGRVDRLTRRDKAEALRVYADVDGKQLNSARIVFARAVLDNTPVRCTAHLAKLAQPRLLRAGRTAWLDPRVVERIEVATNVPDSVVMAHMGGTDRPLVRARKTGPFVLTIDDGTRKAWDEAGALELLVQRGTDSFLARRIVAIPAEPAIPAEGETFSVMQRKRVFVPGTREYLYAVVGDVTAGQVMLTVTTNDGTVLVDQKSLHERDRAEFTMAGTRYAIVVEELKNLLIGDDFVELRFSRASAIKRDPIAELLMVVKNAGVKFERDGKTFDGKTAAIHIRKKLDLLAADPGVDQFIDEVATKSGMTGQAYLVHLDDGSTKTMREWLREQLKALGGAPEQPGR